MAKKTSPLHDDSPPPQLIDYDKLIQELGSRLSIQFDSGHAGFYSSDGTRLEVSLKLDGKEISSDSVSIIEGEFKGGY